MTPPTANTASKTDSAAAVTPFQVTTGALPGSQKIFAQGSELLQGVNVGMRAINLSPKSGEKPVVVYDTSGPYTDAQEKIDITKGLAPLRASWIESRNDTETYDGRAIKPEDNGYKAHQKIEVM